MKKLILVVFLLSFTASLRAQQAETGLNGFKFLAPVQIQFGRDNNFLVDRTSLNEKLFVLSLPAVITGTLAGSHFYSMVQEEGYCRIILIFLGCLGVFTVYRALNG